MDTNDNGEAIVVQMIRQLKAQQQQIAALSMQLEKASMSQNVNHAQNIRDKNNSA